MIGDIGAECAMLGDNSSAEKAIAHLEYIKTKAEERNLFKIMNFCDIQMERINGQNIYSKQRK